MAAEALGMWDKWGFRRFLRGFAVFGAIVLLVLLEGHGGIFMDEGRSLRHAPQPRGAYERVDLGFRARLDES